MPKLSNILNDWDEAIVPTPGGDITIEYYPNRVTQKMIAQIRAFQRVATRETAEDEEFQKALHDTNGQLLILIKSWDLEDEVACKACENCENGDECKSKKIVPFPLDPDRMSELPAWLITAIGEAIIDPNQKAPQKRRERN